MIRDPCFSSQFKTVYTKRDRAEHLPNAPGIVKEKGALSHLTADGIRAPLLSYRLSPRVTRLWLDSQLSVLVCAALA